jgi:hypothetical protein
MRSSGALRVPETLLVIPPFSGNVSDRDRATGPTRSGATSPAVADAFCATRLAGDRGHASGTLPDTADLDAILGRALPPPG